MPALAEAWTAKDTGELVRTLVVAAIWVAYMRRSDRVRRTFVARRIVAAPPPAAVSP